MNVLLALDVLDTTPEEHFDGLVNLGKHMFNVPICLVTLVDVERQWFKACVGLDVSQTGRDEAFCAHAIMPDAPAPFVVHDALADPLFATNPLVVGPPFIRFYAGAPLVLDGHKLGTICAIDTAPRGEFSSEDRRMLTIFAKQVTDGLVTRLDSRRLAKSNEELMDKSTALFTANQELNSLINTANAPIFAIDHNLQVTVWNDKIEQMTSISKAEIYGRCIRELLSAAPPADKTAPPLTDESTEDAGSDDATEDALAAVDNSIASGVSVEGGTAMLQMLSCALEGKQVSCFDFEMLSRNHRRLVQLQVNAEPKVDASGNVVGVVCVGQDVYSQKEMVREHLENLKLKEINRTKDAFLACMSHEMRTPLNGLLGMLQMALAEAERATKLEGSDSQMASKILVAIRRYVTQAKNSGMLLLSLINDILDITRIESGHLALDIATFSLSFALEEAVALLQHKASEKRISLSLEVAPALRAMWLEGDLKRIQQVVLNLVWNALKFTPQGSVRVIASLRDPMGAAEAEAEEEGPGTARLVSSRATGGGEGGGEGGGACIALGGDDVHDEFLKGLKGLPAGCVSMEIDAAEGGLASLETDDFETDDDDFADLAHFEEVADGGLGLGLVTHLVTGLAEDSPKSVAAEDFGAAGRAFGQLGGEWSFSPDDLDSLARLGAMNQPLPVG